MKNFTKTSISVFKKVYNTPTLPDHIIKLQDKLIIRIPFYKNNLQKDLLYSNKNSNLIFNLLTNKFSAYNNIINNNLLNSNNLTKNI